MSEGTKQQPDPIPTDAPATWDLVVADMQERDRFGGTKYGVRHQHDNGRDHLRDAYQEALDLAMYLRAQIERQRATADLLEEAAHYIMGCQANFAIDAERSDDPEIRDMAAVAAKEGARLVAELRAAIQVQPESRLRESVDG